MSYIDRMHEEQRQLQERITKLVAFISSSAYQLLSPVDHGLLLQQLEYMRGYDYVLSRRLARTTTSNA